MTAPPDFDLSGKRALVVGGRGGIGSAISRALSAQGAAVTITGKRTGGRTEGGFPYRQLDVRDGAAVASLAAAFDGLDILVNCLGDLVREGREFEPEVFARIIEVNLVGTYRLCHAFLPKLRPRRGCIINIASTSAFEGTPRLPAYGAAKAGIVQLTKTLARAWAADGVRVNAIAPGSVRTERNRVLQEDPAWSALIEARTPLGRWGMPPEIGGAAVYLASSAAGFVTGAALVVDGGYTA